MASSFAAGLSGVATSAVPSSGMLPFAVCCKYMVTRTNACRDNSFSCCKLCHMMQGIGIAFPAVQEQQEEYLWLCRRGRRRLQDLTEGSLKMFCGLIRPLRLAERLGGIHLTNLPCLAGRLRDLHHTEAIDMSLVSLILYAATSPTKPRGSNSTIRPVKLDMASVRVAHFEDGICMHKCCLALHEVKAKIGEGHQCTDPPLGSKALLAGGHSGLQLRMPGTLLNGSITITV